MIALGTLKTSSAFKLLCRAKHIAPTIADEVSKQIQDYELDLKHAIENNEDEAGPDMDKDLEGLVDINDYVKPEYHQLIEDSKQFMGIKTDIKPHPCARLCYHKDLRYEVGLISLKPKAGETERRVCAYIEGATADAIGLCKNDLLKVDVVDYINRTFHSIGRETPSVDELKSWIAENDQVWSLYAKGYTLGLNQCEKQGSTKKVMNLKPRNVVELAAFVAAIRPGAKSIAPYFFNRELHTYGIPAMDNMLKLEGATGITGESAFVFYDEQILHLAQAAGITPGDAVTLIKSIKKKKKDKVLAYQERFIPGFTKYLIEQENDNEEHAKETSQAVWKVIQDSAAYLFNASHALAMAYDSLYGAMLKTIAPYEFYKELLDLYTRKKQKNKVPLAIREMKAYKNIKMTTGRFREDNRDWLINKDMHTISQSLASIKGISPIVAQEMYDIREMQFETFSDFLYYAKCNMKVNSAQMTTLIKLNYFEEFGRTKKLLDIYEKFDELKITKTLKSWRTRLNTLIEFEKECPNVELPIELRASFEFSMTGLVFSTDVNAAGKYLVAELQTKFGCGFDLYNLQTGLYTNNIRERKSEYDMYPFYIGDVITIPKNGYTKRETYLYQNGEKVKSGMFDWWIHGARKV